jgi:hypothetical protein
MHRSVRTTGTPDRNRIPVTHFPDSDVAPNRCSVALEVPGQKNPRGQRELLQVDRTGRSGTPGRYACMRQALGSGAVGGGNAHTPHTPHPLPSPAQGPVGWNRGAYFVYSMLRWTRLLAQDTMASFSPLVKQSTGRQPSGSEP